VVAGRPPPPSSTRLTNNVRARESGTIFYTRRLLGLPPGNPARALAGRFAGKSISESYAME
jgi:hypothetical protein